MNKINIETYENEKKANFKIYIDEKLEFDAKGLIFKNTSDLMDEIGRHYERYISTKQTGKKVQKGIAKYAGYYEIAQAIEIMPKNEQFTSKDLVRLIVDETSSKFRGTHANISATLSAFKIANWYPDYLKVEGMRGRSRLYMKTKDVPAKQIESDFRKAAKKAWP